MPAADHARKAAGAAAIVAALAAAHEGLKCTPYYDPPGILTVCYGHTGAVQARRYSMDECLALLDADTRRAVDQVDRCQPMLPTNVLAAFSDAAYNIGPAVACDQRHSTAARLLAAGRYSEACNELLKWDKAHVAGQLVALPGLTKRRREERDLCLAPSVATATP